MEDEGKYRQTENSEQRSEDRKQSQSEKRSDCLIPIDKYKHWYYNLTSMLAPKMMQIIIAGISKRARKQRLQKEIMKYKSFQMFNYKCSILK